MWKHRTTCASCRALAAHRTRGCILLEDPALFRQFALDAQAVDSSGRDQAYQELAVMQPRPSHDMAEDAIGERSLLYRFAKKHWFFGFGAYG